MSSPQSSAANAAENGSPNNNNNNSSSSSSSSNHSNNKDNDKGTDANTGPDDSPSTTNNGTDDTINDNRPSPPLSEKDESQKSYSTAVTMPVNNTTSAAAKGAGGGKSTPFRYDPKKITLKFIFANRDGLHVILECEPTDTIGEVKGALLSMWPEDIPECSGGDKIRLICMGKGILMPDTKTLESAEVPIFQTHPTPVNVSVKPESFEENTKGGRGSPKKSSAGGGGGGESGGSGGSGGVECK
mmetsp:Transcript_6371/g.12803  ORF Transcript_6371/g.12803 Transcript_6371/m.12803 type:complete len:243 (+) Transcript_6371:320-1048(+)